MYDFFVYDLIIMNDNYENEIEYRFDFYFLIIT